MAIKYILLVNKFGQTRLARYFEPVDGTEKLARDGEIIRKCLARKDKQCSFIEYQDHKVVYQRYASLYVIIGCDMEENDLAILEFIQFFVETLDDYFRQVCELDIMFSLDRAHFILDEMVVGGDIVDANRRNVLGSVYVLDENARKKK
eukprot:TRINITY_DN8025_c0_g1_i1.p1 TRINITY_DN8025_c0_g1~~TRINITY_DN8025_c0_g1_i1.p1  ORF type:complete len:148 (-),score=18.59 TRINITY_DN8025_c0_g1_i1:44-487(-)